MAYMSNQMTNAEIAVFLLKTVEFRVGVWYNYF